MASVLSRGFSSVAFLRGSSGARRLAWLTRMIISFRRKSHRATGYNGTGALQPAAPIFFLLRYVTFKFWASAVRGFSDILPTQIDHIRAKKRLIDGGFSIVKVGRRQVALNWMILWRNHERGSLHTQVAFLWMVTLCAHHFVEFTRDRHRQRHQVLLWTSKGVALFWEKGKQQSHLT